MALVYGSSTKGEPTLIHHNFEYLRKKQYMNGRISWRCQMYKRFKCKVRFATSDDQVVCEPQVEHTCWRRRSIAGTEGHRRNERMYQQFHVSAKFFTSCCDGTFKFYSLSG